jgi:hypothetical protein
MWSKINLTFLLGAVLAATSCSGSVPLNTALGPSVDKGAVKNLQQQAASESGCQSEPMAYSYIGGSIHRMEGCGLRLDYAYECAGHCGWVSLRQLEQRAKFEFDCETVQVDEIGNGTYGVRACGHRAIYIARHIAWGRFEWVLNSDSHQFEPDSAAGSDAPIGSHAASDDTLNAPAGEEYAADTE